VKKLLPSNKVYVKKSKIPKAGRGVFAKFDIKRGEIIERCPFIKVPKNDLSKLSESFLVTYFIYFGKNKEQIALTLGFGSIYNHSSKPNAVFKIKQKEKLIEFVALSNIKKDIEITFNYNGSDNKVHKNPLWFEV
jgi:SET domain-containing protein